MFDIGQRLGDAVEKRLGAEEADVGMKLRLPCQMLAAAETDLQPHFARARRKQRCRIERACRRLRYRDGRQQRLHTPGLRLRQGLAGRAAIEAVCGMTGRVGVHAAPKHPRGANVQKAGRFRRQRVSSSLQTEGLE